MTDALYPLSKLTPPYPTINKDGSVTETLKQGQELLVQIVKNPYRAKGPRLTTEITFTGRFMVLIPFSEKISISQKLSLPKRECVSKQLIEHINPKIPRRYYTHFC